MVGTQHNVAFPRKLYDLIEAEPNWLIEWAGHGDAFFIRDQDEFCSLVLAKYFRHTKLTSFQRQLNLYGFRRITKGPDTGAYSHPLFSRDNPVHVDTIKRVVRKGGGGVEERSAGRWTPHHGHHKKYPSPSSSSSATGTIAESPNSPHSFPDGQSAVARSSRTSSRTHRGQSWAHLNDDEDEDALVDDDEEEEDEGDGDYDDEEEYTPSGRRRPRSGNGNAYSKPYLTHSGSGPAAGRSSGRGRRGAAPVEGKDERGGGSGNGGNGAASSALGTSGVGVSSEAAGDTEDYGAAADAWPRERSMSRSAPTSGGFGAAPSFTGFSGIGGGGKGLLLRGNGQNGQHQQQQHQQQGAQQQATPQPPLAPLQGLTSDAMAMPPPLSRVSSGSGGYWGNGNGNLGYPPASSPVSPHSYPPPGAAGNYFLSRSASSESACDMNDQQASSSFPAYSQQIPQSQLPQQVNALGSNGGNGLGSLPVPMLARGTSDSLAGSEQWQIDDRFLGAAAVGGGGGGDSMLDLTVLAGLEGGSTFDDLETFSFDDLEAIARANGGNGGGAAGSSAAATGSGSGSNGASNGGFVANGGSFGGGCGVEHSRQETGGSGSSGGYSGDGEDDAAFQMDMENS